MSTELPPKSERLKKASPWDEATGSKLKVRCKNRYGDVAYFVERKDQGVFLIAFGDDGYEPDKDGMLIDKQDIPKIIEFLQGIKEPEAAGRVCEVTGSVIFSQEWLSEPGCNCNQCRCFFNGRAKEATKEKS